jgi:hypothetical protein
MGFVSLHDERAEKLTITTPNIYNAEADMSCHGKPLVIPGSIFKQIGLHWRTSSTVTGNITQLQL